MIRNHLFFLSSNVYIIQRYANVLKYVSVNNLPTTYCNFNGIEKNLGVKIIFIFRYTSIVHLVSYSLPKTILDGVTAE